MMFALLTAFLLAGLAQAGWLGNGQSEWSARCALGSEMEGEFVCFTSASDITQKSASGTWSGYAASDGLAFALIQSSSSGELMSMPDHTINIEWLGGSSAHVIVQDYVNNGWVTAAEGDTDNPDQKTIFQLSGGGNKRSSAVRRAGDHAGGHAGGRGGHPGGQEGGHEGGHGGGKAPAGKGTGHGKHPPEQA
ncbi:uncharacterized protein PAN0_007c3202 [Moesziomyces antarcticus]|uniref:Uncharacterized protein n=2 Tax=Pseudozyma antarctica TaxID=84753 RepID=A0A5C3FQE9_PSEA2|nr:uncharacterized protein PAN0_007c3202 [Moesziomyces antarcticus]GAK64986.1 hypothetical protein PAN0_007c3202 [Moesziomyces antarcticus]SPO46025.1 uncharacterized protein PSANT_03711 [Moesziomyces antarcticus]